VENGTAGLVGEEKPLHGRISRGSGEGGSHPGRYGTRFASLDVKEGELEKLLGNYVPEDED